MLNTASSVQRDYSWEIVVTNELLGRTMQTVRIYSVFAAYESMIKLKADLLKHRVVEMATKAVRTYKSRKRS